MYSNIDSVVCNALCIGCGACEGTCPVQAIKMNYNLSGFLVPIIDCEKCIHCRKCCSVCPSVSDNYINKNSIDIFHGVYKEGYVGYATNLKIRRKSQSGGLATALLCYLIDNGSIDGAVVNTFNKKINRPEATFQTTREGIIQSAGSYYSQSSVVKAILENNNKKMAAVVLGCQAESIKHLTEKDKSFNRPEYLIGLFCAGQYSGNYIDALIRASDANEKDVIGFRFRDKEAGGWPGNVKVYTEKKNYVLSRRKRHQLKTVYEVPRCLICFNMMCGNCDLVLGDPWGIEGKDESDGNTVVIARTDKGNELIKKAALDGVISIESLCVDSIFKGQAVDSRLKTQFVAMMKYLKSKSLMSPYKDSLLNEIESIEPNRQLRRQLIKRFELSKKIFLTDNVFVYKRIIWSSIFIKTVVKTVNYYYRGLVSKFKSIL